MTSDLWRNFAYWKQELLDSQAFNLYRRDVGPGSDT